MENPVPLTVAMDGQSASQPPVMETDASQFSGGWYKLFPLLPVVEGNIGRDQVRGSFQIAILTAYLKQLVEKYWKWPFSPFALIRYIAIEK